MSTIQKRKDAAPAATDPRHGSNLTHTGEVMNVHMNNTAPAVSASEDAPRKVIRLAKEISRTLDECEDYQMVVIYRRSAYEYPISMCLDADYSRMTSAMFAYRDAIKALVDCRGGKGIRKLTRDRDIAHDDLVAAFMEALA